MREQAIAGLVAGRHLVWAGSGGWEAWMQGRNLTDRHYSDSSSSSYSGVGAYTPNTQNQYTTGAPRSLMVGLSYDFEGKK